MRISDWSSDVCSSDLPTRNSGAPESPPSTAPPCRSALGRDSHYTGKASRPSALLQSHEARMNTSTAPGPGPHGSNFRPSELDKFRSEEHTSELQSLMSISYAVFCFKKKKQNNIID